MNDKPEKELIDILKMEIEQKLPHWLSLPQRDPKRAQAIRDKHRAKWLEQQKQKRKAAKSLSDWTPVENALRQGEWKDTKARALRARRRKS